MVSGVVLAAGRSIRMGRPKQLLEWKGGPLLGHAIRAALDSSCDEVVVVLGHAADEVRKVVASPAKAVVNPDLDGGQASSLRVGLDACAPGTEAAVILLGDQPQVTASAIETVLEHWRGGSRPIVRSHYSDGVGHPVLLARSVWSELASTGDEGARTIMRTHPELTDEVRFPGNGPRDVDSPEDYRALLESSE